MTDPARDALAVRLARLAPPQLVQLVKGLQDRIDALRARLDAPIAVIGMGLRLPGAADPDAFWDLLCRGGVAISEVPASRWDAAALAAAGVPRFGGFIGAIDGFDAAFFRIPPAEAATMDPQQRLAAEVAWEALERAGYALAERRPEATGVFLGVTTDDYKARFLAGDPAGIDPRMATGTAVSIAAGRLSYLFGLSGPSMVVDTACSSSLVAAHLACRSLRAGECDMALAGGVGLLVEPELSVAFSKLGMLSPRSRCSTFAAEADGYVRGEGAAILVLRRLADARRDGDPVLAVIRGSATNQDGRSNGLTAPNGSAQRAVIGAALADAGLSAADIDAVECHGTATPLGDPIEVEAIGDTYGAGRDGAPLLLGSVKANIGHLEAAAGAAGLAKAVLCLMHGAMPPQPAHGPLNPRIAWDALKLRVADGIETLAPAAGRPARMGVSSFGFSGSNAHLILEAAPPAEAAAVPAVSPHLVAISAPAAETLVAWAGRVGEALARPSAPAADIARNVIVDRPLHEWRCAAVAADAPAVATSLFAAAGRVASPCGGPPRIAFVFTGQGSQWPGMARVLAAQEPAFRAALNECAELLRAHLDVALPDLLWPDTPAGAARLDQTGYAQPAIFAVQYALTRLWRHWDVRPALVAGHSIGEYAAACDGGVMDLPDALELVCARGRLMQSLPQGGGMLALAVSEAEARDRLAAHPELDLAAVNAPEATVVAGPLAALDALAATLPEAVVRRLRVSHAFHSRAMEPIRDAFAEAVARVRLRRAAQPIVSSLTGRPADEVMQDAAYWVRQLRDPVRFADAATALREHGCEAVIEIGPRPVLLSLIAPQARLLLPSMRERETTGAAVLHSLAVLFSAGAEIDWRAFHADRGTRPAPAPTMPFRRERHWTERPKPLATPATPVPAPALPAALAVTASTATPQAIRDILAEAMQLPASAIRPDVPFVEQGADSLILTQLGARIERRFGVTIPARALFGALNTVDALHAHVVASAIAPAPEPPGPPASAAHVARLAQRLRERMPGSVRSRDDGVAGLADSRGSAGFRPAVKSLLYPLVGDRADGATIRDVDGNDYLDITMGFGVQLFGHAAPFIADALRAQLDRGLQIGPQAKLAGEAARLIVRLTGVERVAFCNTGTEAVMTAVRLARAATGRARVALFDGSYHGHFDGILARTGTAGDVAQPLSPGTPASLVQDLLVLDYADPDAAFAALERHRDTLAAVLVEPIQSRRPGLQPRDFLRALRDWTERAGVALIFDEVLLGFRIALAGAQDWAGVRADLVTYGKIIGGGLPIGAVAGRGAFMDRLDGGAWRSGDSGPAGPTIFFAGTFNKNPLTMAASVAVLERLEQEGPSLQEQLNARTAALASRLNAALAARTPALRVDAASSLFRFVGAPDLFYYHLLERGLYVWEGRTCFLSTRHTEADADRIVQAVAASADALVADGMLPAGAAPAPVPAVAEIIALTPGQQALWTACQMSEAASAAYNQSLRIGFAAEPDRAALGRALTALVRRHANLRARFQPDGRTLRIGAAAQVEVEALQGDPEQAEHALCWREFDLEHGPLLRACLAAHDGVWRLTLVLPHLVTDGWSLGVMAGELAALYRAELSGTLAVLRPPDAPRDFPATADPAHAQAWRHRFTPPPPPLDLPTARPRPAAQTHEGGRVTRRLGAERVRRLRALCGRTGVGLSAAGLAAYALLLGRLGRTRDIAVGVLSAGQPAHDMPRLVGYYASLLPLRLTLDPAASFAELLTACQTEIDAATGRRNFVFADLVRSLRLPRDPARPPLVSVAFNLDRLDAPPEFGIPVTLEGNVHGAVRWDLFLNLVVTAEAIELQADYPTWLFDAAQVEGWADAYIAWLDRIVTAPDAAQASAPLVARVLHHAAIRPAAVAVEDGTLALTYGDLLREVDGLAARLRGAGVAAGAVVAADLGRSVGMIVAMLAAWRLGAVFMPLEPTHPPDHRRALIADAGAACVIGDTASDATPCITWRLGGGGEIFDAATPAADDTAYLLYTSGSTGRPKAVLVGHGAVAAYTDAMLERLDIPRAGAAWRFGVVSSLAADLGYTCVFAALSTGGTLRIFQDSEIRDPAGFVAAMQAAPVDMLKIVPAHLSALLDWPDPAVMLPRQRLVLGGEAARWPLVETVWRLSPACRVFNHYGPTETTIGAAAVALTPAIRALSPDSVPLGQALGHATIRVEEGEIVIGGDGVARGYLNRPKEDAARFVPDPFGPIGARRYRTGDRGAIGPDGMLLFQGRLDDEVKIRGHRVVPDTVAAQLAGCPGVRDVHVSVGPTVRGEPRLIAHVAASPPLTEAAVRAWASARLPPAMVPQAIVVADALPRTANGKIDRQTLRAAPPPAPLASNDADLADTLLGIWRGVLAMPEAGPDEDFFALGGDSIMAIQIAARARAFDLRFNAQLLFEHPTVNRLLAVADTCGRPASAAPCDASATDIPLSPVQAAFFALDLPRPQHWCLCAVLRLPGRPGADAVTRALRAIGARHPALRLRFRRQRGRVLQHLAGDAALAAPATIAQGGLDDAARRELEDALAADGIATIDLANGPLLATALLDRGAREPSALLVVVHHLVFDVVSWSVFADELMAAFGGAAPPAPAGAGFDAWCRALARHAATCDGELAFWHATEARIAPLLPRLPADAPDNREGRVLRATIHLPAQTTASLRRHAPQQGGAGLRDVVLTALAASLGHDARVPLVIDVEGHGREAIDPALDAAGMLGWFTTHFPLALGVDPSHDPVRQIASVREAWQRLPGNGLGYGLLRHLRVADGLGRDPEVSFNFLGTLHAGTATSSRFERFGSVAERDPAAPRRHLLVVEAFVAQGALTIDLLYPRDLVAAGTIAGIRERIAAWLVALAADRPRAAAPAGALALSDDELRVLGARLGL